MYNTSPMQLRPFHFRPTIPLQKRKITTSPRFPPLKTLEPYNISTFRSENFNPGIPVLLPNQFSSIPAISKWFIPSSSSTSNPKNSEQKDDIKQLNTAYLNQYADTLVPLELTNPTTSTFNRFSAPLSLFLSFTSTPQNQPTQTLYLAQCPLNDLPSPLQSDLPIPELVSTAGKGDIYTSSIWLGHPPTYTPLHRDPNPNLFIQLAGKKVIRLMEPEVGRAVYERVRAGAGHAHLRGEEMMMGEEREGLEEVVWGDGGVEGEEGGWEARLGVGDAVFIPMGWWHSVRGYGEGVTGSVNFWFR